MDFNMIKTGYAPFIQFELSVFFELPVFELSKFYSITSYKIIKESITYKLVSMSTILAYFDYSCAYICIFMSLLTFIRRWHVQIISLNNFIKSGDFKGQNIC